MKIAYSWLKDYLKTNKSADELSKILTDIGLEVESVEQFESIKGGLKNIVIGEVLTKTKHPDANKLSLTTVNIGSAVLNIVCGASNVEAGQKVLIATIGTVIHKSNECFTIQKTKIRGAVSEGMICAEDEIGLGESHSGIMVLPSDAPVGLPASQYFNVIEDTVFEIGLTPNRSDATSYIGVAKDLYAALYCKNLINSDKEPASLFLNIPIIDSFSPNLDNINPEIIIEDKQACHRYSGMLIKNIKVSSSPDWLKNKLLASGIRSINNIVDVTNFVMLETGQPLHAFDFDKIKGNKVIIKKYENPFKFVTLDGNEREMTTDDLMICNAEGPMCIAGIFGGQDSGVTDETKTIFLESANFDPKSIHKSSKYHSLTTDSSFRFERGADLEITIFALKRAALILSEISGKDANLYFSDITDIYPKPVQKTVIKANYNNIFRLIGNSIDKNIIIKILEKLDFTFIDKNEEGFIVEVPTNKVDVLREADIIEEILRIYGYNNIIMPDFIKLPYNLRQKPDREKLQNFISDFLVNNNFYELFCNSLCKASFNKPETNIKLMNPLSKELDSLRQSLLYNGLEAIAYNINHKKKDLKLFEFGKVYKLNSDSETPNKYHEQFILALYITGKKYKENWRLTNWDIDIYDLKETVTSLLLKLNFIADDIKFEEFSKKDCFSYGHNIFIKNILIGEIGSLNSKSLKIFDISNTIIYANLDWDKLIYLCNNVIITEELPKYPEVKRDLALMLNENINYSDIEIVIKKLNNPLIKSFSLFDYFTGGDIPQGKKSYALRFILQDKEKTMTDKGIDKILTEIKNTIRLNLKGEIR